LVFSGSVVGDSAAGGGGVLAGSAALVAASGEVVGLVAGVTVSVFCSHAASSAAPARMQMYFFIDRKFG
jgi:hypothetical protein